MRPLAICAGVTLALLLAAILPAAAQTPPAALCRAIGTDDTLRPLPAALVPATTRLFHLDAMPAEQIARSSYYRCDGGHVFVCTTGANLPCGKANTARHLAAADQWCAEHQDADFIPAYVTGHDTIYAWKCVGAKAAIAKSVFKRDRRGFISEFWKGIRG